MDQEDHLFERITLQTDGERIHSEPAQKIRRCVPEFTGRHNAGDLDTLAQMTVLARGLERRRSRYDDLVADNA